MKNAIPALIAALLVWSCPLAAQESKPRATFKGHEEELESLAFSPDGKTLASGERHSVKLWNLESGKCIATLKEDDPNLWSRVAFSPDGKTLATGGWFNKVKLWDVKTLKGKVILDEEHQCPPPSVVFSSDGKSLASGASVEMK